MTASRTSEDTVAGTIAAPLLSVVVPTRNEAANVLALWQELETTLAEVDFEVCFVDDSDDETPALLTKLQVAHAARVRCLLRSGAERTGGLATAVVAGLRLARGRYVCVMDADLQHPPHTISAMLAAAEGGADLVVASRYTGGGSRRGLDGFMRRAVSRAATWSARLLFSEARRSTDPLAGFFLCRRELIDGIEFRPVGFKILLELLVCVPSLHVVDVPLNFAPRAGGESKASMAQGVMFARHLMSLFFDVDGSARFWKFGAIGVSGLMLFELLLWAGLSFWHLPRVAAFLVAFVPSLMWNTFLNRRWTFADISRRSGNRDVVRYFERALVSGVTMLAVFLLATSVLNIESLRAGLAAALIAMLINGLSNYQATHRSPLLWTQVAFDRDVAQALQRLARRVDADRAYMLPPETTGGGHIPQPILERAVALRRAAVWTEVPSHRSQRRTNIEVESALVIPVVENTAVVGVVVFERYAPAGFAAADLRTALTDVETLAPLLVKAAARPQPQRLRALARNAPQAD